MLKTLAVAGVLALGLSATSCNDDSGFQEGNGKVENTTEESAPQGDDAVGQVGSSDNTADESIAEIGKIENKNIIEEETEVAARNPFLAEESSIFSFVASQELDDEIPITLDLKDAMVDFKLKNNESPGELNTNQKTRTPVTENFYQGTPGKQMTDTFDQAEKKGIVDILVVIDDSGSMAKEQENLSDKLDDLLVYLDKTNWQIGVVTTTYDNNDCQLTLIDYQDPNAAMKFAAAVEPGTNGSGNEQGIRQAVKGLKCESNPWVRANSSVAVLIVSDEDNCSSEGKGCKDKDWETEQYLIDYVESSIGRTVGQNAGFYGIFSHPDDPCNTAYNTGVQYAKLVDYKANGQQHWGDICDNDYGNTLRKISENISSLLLNQWELTTEPDAGSAVKVELEINGVKTPVAATAYTLVGKTLTFLQGQEPPLGSKIVVTYTVGAKPEFNKVTLKNNPAAGTLMINVNDVALNAGAFTVAGKEITFDPRPVANAKVSVYYRIDTPLDTMFSLGANTNPKANTFTVYVDDVATTDYTYDAAGKYITFDATPTDGQKIQVKYTNIDGPVLSYEPALIGNNPKNFRLFYNDMPVDFTKAGDVFTILAADHVVDRTLVLKYEIDNDVEKMLNLPNLPIDDSLVITSDSTNCDLGSGFAIAGAVLTIDCVIMEMTEFVLNYRYLGPLKSFVVEGIDTPDQSAWEVRVDGVKTDAYQRMGKTIILDENPAVGARVDVYVTKGDFQ